MAFSRFSSLFLSVAIFCTCFGFPSVESNDSHYDTQDLPPVILVPGLGGSELQAKFDNPPLPEECSNFTGEENKKWFTLYLNDDMTDSASTRNCLVKSLSLVFDNKTGKSHNLPGIETRPKGWGTVNGISSIDVQGNLPYFEYMISVLSEHGYVPGENLFGAPYDFRYAPNQLKDFFTKLETLIEETVVKKESPVLLVAHSMGAPLLALFLNGKTSEWRKQNIVSMVTLSGAWGGAVNSFDALFTGMGGYPFMIPQLRTDQSLMYMMPDLDLWGEHDSIVTVGGREYSMLDIEYLLTQMNSTDDADMYRWQAEYHKKTSIAPHVPLHCLYGDKVKTVESYEFHDWESYPDSPSKTTYGNGDGTVNHRSLDVCTRFKEFQSEPVSVKAFEGITHDSMITAYVVFEYLMKEIKEIATKRHNDRKQTNEEQSEVVGGQEDYFEDVEYERRALIMRQLKDKLKSGFAPSKNPIISLRDLVGAPN